MNTDDQNTKTDEEIEENDVVIEETDEEGNPGDVVRKLREKLATAVAEKQSYLDGWQRTQADFVNYKKRELEERENLIKYANEPLISDIIPALDNFDIAMGNKEAWEKADKNWRIGIEYIYSELVKTLERYGVKQVNPMGEAFSAALHEPTEAVMTENPAEDGKIVAVLQKGYTLNGKNIRPAKVKVGELKK